MKSWNKQVSLLRVTTLTAALMGVYGVAGAVPGNLSCLDSSTCQNSSYSGEYFLESPSGVKGVVHGSNGAAFTVENSLIEGSNKARGVLADNGANITLDGVTITTDGGSGHGVQSHQSNGSLPLSHITINDSTVTTKSAAYAVGILAQKGTSISGSNVDIVTNGDYGSGVEVDRGGQVNLQGAEDLSTIVANGVGAAGARAISGKEVGATAGSITLDRYRVESQQGVGLMAGDEDGAEQPTSAGNITFTNGEVLASGAGSSTTHMGAAARVMYGSTLTVKNSELTSEQHHGVVVDGSTAKFTDTDIVTNGAGALGAPVAALRASNSADVKVTNGSINATAEGAAYTRGILAMSDATVTTDKTDIGTQGDHSHAVHAWGAPDLSTKPKVTIEEGDITTQGFESYGLSAQNSGEIATENAHITTEGTWGFGAFAYKEGVLDIKGGSITTNGLEAKENVINGYPVDVGNYGVLAKNKSSATITGTTVTTKGQYAEGLRAENDGAEGNVLNTASTITANDVTVQTSGDEAHGVTAYGANAEGLEWLSGSTLSFTDGSITTSGEDARGALAVNGGLIKLTDTTITTSGEGADGVAAAVLVAEDPILPKIAPLAIGPIGYAPSGVELNNVHIKVSGKDAAGLVAYNGDSEIAMKGGSITATGENSAGLQLVNDADIDLDGVTVQANGPSIRSYFGTDEGAAGLESDFEQTVELKGSDFTLNNSQFLHVTRAEGGENGVITVSLRDGTTAIGNVENYDGAGKLSSSANTHIEVDSTSSWVGVMMDDKTNVAQSGDTVTGSQAGNVTAPDGSSVSFQNVPTIAGSVSSTLGSSFTFSGSPTSIAGGVFGMPQSTTTFNNDVHIQGDGTEQQGGFALNGVGSSFAFNGNATIDGPVQGDGSGFSFSQTGLTSLASLNLNNFSYPIFDLDAWMKEWRERMEQQRQQWLEEMAKAQAQLLAMNAEMRQRLSLISGGSINNPIDIHGDVEATGGSTLGGNLNIGGELNSVASFVAPGNSIGTITTDTLGTVAGSVFEFEVDGNGQADLLVVRNGDADLKGAALKVDQYEGYRLDHDYTIIRTEAGNVVNTFDSEGLGDTFAGTLVKLDPVKYGAQDVKVSLSVNNAAIDRTGLSANQNATLDGVLSVAGDNASADATLLMQADARKDALNQLSGELHGSTQAALLQTSSLVSRTLSARMRGNLGAGMQPGAPTAQAGGAVAGSMPTSAAYPLWAQVVGNWNTLDSDGNAAKVKTNTAGLFIGGDTDVGSGWRVGGALGYTDGRVKVDDRDSRSDVGTFTAALYGGNSWDQGNGKLNFLAGAAYSHHSIDTRRSVNVGGNQTLKADYSAHTTQLFTELGYAMPVGERSVVEPYVGLAWLSQKARGFTEEGGAAALSADSQKDDVTTFTLGLRGKTALNVGSNPAHLFAGLGWRHASGDVDPGRSVSFVQGGGAAFNVAGAPIAKNAAVLDLGVEMSVGRNTAMGLGYSGQYGSDNTDHSGQLYLRARF